MSNVIHYITLLQVGFSANTPPLKLSGFAFSIRGASSRGIPESQERQPPLKASTRCSKERGTQKVN